MNPDRARTRSPTSGEPLLRIGAVGARTGLSSHVIRVWERRYDAVTPHRTPGGTRMYDVRHVERLKLRAELTESGYAISAIAGLGNLRGVTPNAAIADRYLRSVVCVAMSACLLAPVLYMSARPPTDVHSWLENELPRVGSAAGLA